MRRDGGGDVRVGVVGYGPAGAFFHAPLIAATPGLRLTAVVTRDADRRARALHDHPGVTVLSRAEELWSGAERVDLVVIASPNRTHVPLAREALAADIPVVVDKPFAPTVAEGLALVAEAERRGLMLTVFQNRRWDGDFLTVRRLRDEGAFGEVFRFESRFERWRPAPSGTWRESGAEEDAGGLLYDLGSHLIDQAMVLFGPVSRVYAELDRRRAGVEADDDAFVALHHVSGVRSHLWMSALSPLAGPRMRVAGSRAGYLKYGLDIQEDALRRGIRPGTPGWGEEREERWGRLGAGNEDRAVRTDAGAYPHFYSKVAAALRDAGGAAPVDPREVVAALEVIQGARRSAEAQAAIALPYPGTQSSG